MRIIHFEDEWAKTRSVAHRLHDKIFEFLPPERAIELELNEQENLKSANPSTITVTLNEKLRKTIFEYVFVTELATLREMATKRDTVVVDIMRSDQNGRFVSILDDIIGLLERPGFAKSNWRYFSAYPEKVPEGCELQGFTKRQDKELVDFLFAQVFKELFGK